VEKTVKLTNDIMNRLSKFFSSYKWKVKFLKNLAHERKAENEIILLVCCYLDQLGGCLFPEDGSSRLNFERILSTHSGESEEFSLISVADLALDLLWMAERAFHTIAKPGRIQLASDDLKPLIKFMDQSGMALTERPVRRLFASLFDTLKTNFRIHPYQTENKKSYGYEDVVINLIISCPTLGRIGAKITEESAKNLVREYTYKSILYREYRCKAVHEAAGIYVDTKKFWKMQRPYFVEVSTFWFPRSAFKLEFPCSFLVECLETCVKCAEKAIIGKGLLPLPIWNAICNFDEFEFLDVERIGEVKPIKLRIE
jgi:hypothetical protein